MKRLIAGLILIMGFIITTPVMAETIDLSYEDAQMLMGIAQSEAKIDGVEGMAVVMQVVLNRVEDPAFPDTVEEVITQKSGRVYQFSPVGNGSFYKVELEVETHVALAKVEQGKYKWVRALYFENKNVHGWQERNLDYLYSVGNHKFYK